MKNILVYTHMPHFDFKDGGTVVQYLLAKTLEEMGLNVRIYSNTGICINNIIFSKFYNNDFPIDENCVVIYCEGTLGNPLKAPLVVRWMLSKLGQNVPHYFLDTWDKNELVYYFNSEEKISNNPDKLGFIYKLLNVIYINPYAVNNNLPNRIGTCFTIRKAVHIHGHIYQMIHPPESQEITRGHTQMDCINIFNHHKYFISYDSLTFLSVIAALCGCISIVKKVEGLSKEDWINTSVAAEYLKVSGEDMLFGIAYGNEEIEVEKAASTLHLAKEQWERIVQFSKDKYVAKFIEDINDFTNMENRIHNNF
jgi:hypothetical protein